jgi:hypothetical protein
VTDDEVGQAARALAVRSGMDLHASERAVREVAGPYSRTEYRRLFVEALQRCCAGTKRLAEQSGAMAPERSVHRRLLTDALASLRRDRPLDEGLVDGLLAEARAVWPVIIVDELVVSSAPKASGTTPGPISPSKVPQRPGRESTASPRTPLDEQPLRRPASADRRVRRRRSLWQWLLGA